MLAGKKTLITMSVALAVALYQYYVGPIEAVNPHLWNIAVPVSGIILRILTKGPVTGLGSST